MKNDVQSLVENNSKILFENFRFMVLVDAGVDLNFYMKDDLARKKVEALYLKEKHMGSSYADSMEIICEKNKVQYTLNYRYEICDGAISLNMQMVRNGKAWDMPFMDFNGVKYNR